MLSFMSRSVISLAAVGLFFPTAPWAESTSPVPSEAPASKEAAVQILGPFTGQVVAVGAFKGDIRELPKADMREVRETLEGHERFVGPGFAPISDRSAPFRDPVWQDSLGRTPESVTTLSAPILNFAGLTSVVQPHDPVGDVGLNHFVQAINGSAGHAVFAVYDKIGGLLAGPTTLDLLFASLPGPCTNGSGDPIVLYDQPADRWIIGQIAQPASACIAVSQGPSPLGPFYVYEFNLGGFPDYWKISVWPDAYYVSANLGGYVLASALERARMLSVTCINPRQATFLVSGLPGLGFNTLLPSDLDGPTLPPAGSRNYFYRQVDGNAFGGVDRLELFEFQVDWASLAFAFTGPTKIPTSSFDMSLCGFLSFGCAPQPPPGVRLDPLNEIGMWRFVYRNFVPPGSASHETLLGNFVVDANGSNLHGIRWFELRRTGSGPWSLYQEGTFSPQTTPGQTEHRWMGSIAMDGNGDTALGYAISGSSLFPGLRYTGRSATDPRGTMPQGEQVLVNGVSANTFNRWGDYFSMSIDPADDCTFWFTGDYQDTGAVGHRTRIGTFKINGCGPTCGDGAVAAPGETCDPPGSPTCDCCSPHNSPGCSNSYCVSAVCAIDPSCCSSRWKSSCVSLALANPVCSTCCTTSCGADCTYCGDGSVGDAEQCDDSNYVNGDGCDSTCHVVCGDGFTVARETCDPPGAAVCNCCSAHPGPGCSNSACSNSVCAADPSCCTGPWTPVCAARASNDPACACCNVACGASCQYCGDGVVDAGEQCDDGNFVGGDGCSATCSVVCGNGLVDAGETCDPPGPIGNCCIKHAGNHCTDPGCEAAVCLRFPFCCNAASTFWDDYCVEGALTTPACAGGCNGCRSDCTSCGDGIVDVAERCDPPAPFLGSNCCGAHPGPACDDPLCSAAVCAAAPLCCDPAHDWDAACGARALAEPRCAGCAPQGLCNAICCIDSDSDGVCDPSDACPFESDPNGYFSQTLHAIDKSTFGWSHPANVDWLIGDLSLVSSYNVLSVTAATGVRAFSPVLPPGRGFYFVVRPGCWRGSWRSVPAPKECLGSPMCLPGGRDGNFPSPLPAP